MDLKAKVAAIPYWYHRIEMPDGTVTPGWAPMDPERYCIPEDLTGKRVLDIGAWDGYWTWEALKRGAGEVVAIDDFSDDMGIPEKIKRNGWETFDLCREAFGFHKSIPYGSGAFPCAIAAWSNTKGQIVQRGELDIYDLPEVDGIGEFDIVFFFGTIYHLKHPLLALEKISDVCNGAIYVETASLDEYSPYRGGIGSGFSQNEMVMEFYPGKEYACNESNWWAPTLQCLGAMLATVGFQDIECWPLTETPKELSQCRGFASGTKDLQNNPANHPPEVTTHVPLERIKVAAVMSVPRLGFIDNATCAVEALWPLGIQMISVQGAFWGQCLERGMMQLIDAGIDVILTIDYDTAFKKADVEGLLQILHQNPDAAAVVPVQRGRGGMPMLMSMKGRSGQVRKDVPLTELQTADISQIATGHYGLTVFRVSDLLDVPHPWLLGQPNSDGHWGPGRIDDDIWLWKQLEKQGKKVLLANRIVIGHMELMVRWPGEDMQPVYQVPSEFHSGGKPANIWK